MANENIQLAAEYEEYNAKIENAKTEEEAAAIMKEYFPAIADGTTGDGELSESQLDGVTGGANFTVKNQGVPIFNKKMKIIGTLDKGAAVSGKYCWGSPMSGLFGLVDGTQWIDVGNGGYINVKNLTKVS